MNTPIRRRKEDLPLETPNADGNVWPKQCCPAFIPRKGSFSKECWYCCHADFHLDKAKALEVGICCYPQVILE